MDFDKIINQELMDWLDDYLTITNDDEFTSSIDIYYEYTGHPNGNVSYSIYNYNDNYISEDIEGLLTGGLGEFKIYHVVFIQGNDDSDYTKLKNDFTRRMQLKYPEKDYYIVDIWSSGLLSPNSAYRTLVAIEIKIPITIRDK